MNIERAKRIADSFTGSVSLKVSQFRQGLLVQYRKESCYFPRESCFWVYIFALADVPAAYMDNVGRSLPGSG
ncbi:MAG: hypothetical protein Q9M08_04905 [Mariprofundus sp.]|nr:hypothetical protein [Mariprofundus sp.]